MSNSNDINDMKDLKDPSKIVGSVVVSADDNGRLVLEKDGKKIFAGLRYVSYEEEPLDEHMATIDILLGLREKVHTLTLIGWGMVGVVASYAIIELLQIVGVL